MLYSTLQYTQFCRNFLHALPPLYITTCNGAHRTRTRYTRCIAHSGRVRIYVLREETTTTTYTRTCALTLSLSLCISRLSSPGIPSPFVSQYNGTVIGNLKAELNSVYPREFRYFCLKSHVIMSFTRAGATSLYASASFLRAAI